jgi:transposase
VIWEEDEPMMGMQAAPEQLFYDFCLEDHVPGDNMLRRIDDFLDLDDIRRELARFPARWNHLAEKESRQVNMLEQILVGEVIQLRRDLL